MIQARINTSQRCSFGTCSFWRSLPPTPRNRESLSVGGGIAYGGQFDATGANVGDLCANLVGSPRRGGWSRPSDVLPGADSCSLMHRRFPNGQDLLSARAIAFGRRGRKNRPKSCGKTGPKRSQKGSAPLAAPSVLPVAYLLIGLVFRRIGVWSRKPVWEQSYRGFESLPLRFIEKAAGHQSGKAQKRTVISRLPEAAREPSGEKATLRTGAECPW
jgi:hypothetical protein